MTITNDTFTSLAFPVVKVRYSGTSSQWTATCRRDNERTYRATMPYDYSLSGGASQAILAAKRCYAKALWADAPDTSVDDYVAIPGDLDADTYSFTFVPRYFFN